MEIDRSVPEEVDVLAHQHRKLKFGRNLAQREVAMLDAPVAPLLRPPILLPDPDGPPAGRWTVTPRLDFLSGAAPPNNQRHPQRRKHRQACCESEEDAPGGHALILVGRLGPW